MANYLIMIRGGGDAVTFSVSGDEAAYEAYNKALALVMPLGGCCDLLTEDGCEAIESYGYEIDEDFWIASTEQEVDDYEEDELRFWIEEERR